MTTRLFRFAVITLTALAVLAPLSLVFYQSFLDQPFFQAGAKLGFDAYAFVLTEDDFWTAFFTTITISAGMTAIAVPLGAVLAFLMVRTDVPGRGLLEPLILVPIFVSAVVIAFGYVVALGPVGIFSTMAKSAFGVVPWNLYSLPSLIAIAGLTHVPHVYLYSAAALRGLGTDLEEAARVAGANPLRVAIDVSLPMVLPAIMFAGVLVFFLGFELFGLPLVLGDPQGVLVLSTYLYKLTNILGTPSYQLMAVVVVAIVADDGPAGLSPAPAAAPVPALRLGARQGPQGDPAAARRLALAGGRRHHALVRRHGRGAADRDRGALLRGHLGRRRQPARRAHAGSLPRDPRLSEHRARHRQHIRRSA